MKPLTAHDIILRPVMSEKAFEYAAVEDKKQRKYAFYVHPTATKTTAKAAIEEVFGVSVVKMNLMKLQGKEKSLGRYHGRRPMRKKVIVTLKAGDRISQLDGLIEAG